MRQTFSSNIAGSNARNVEYKIRKSVQSSRFFKEAKGSDRAQESAEDSLDRDPDRHHPPSLFTYDCKNHRFGCDFTSPKRGILQDHETVCELTSVQTERPFACPKRPKAFDTKLNLVRHERDTHDAFIARTCPNPRPSCDKDKMTPMDRQR